MLTLALEVSAIIPSLLLLWYFQTRDVYPEPPRVIWITFGLGILSTIPVLMVAAPLDQVLSALAPQSPYVYGFLDALVLAAVPEEFFKYLVLTLYAARHKEFDEPMDGVVYGVAASLGFATLENLLYVSDGGLGVAIMRALTAVPGHAMMGAIMGYYVGQAKFASQDRKAGLAFKALLIPMALHTLYDFPLLTMHKYDELALLAGDWEGAWLSLGALGVLVFEWIIAVRLTKGLRRVQLAEAGAEVRAKAGRHAFAFGLAGTIGGAVVATVGGLIGLVAMLALAFGQNEPGEVVPLVIGGAVAGGLPLVVGVFLFVWGIRKLNSLPPKPAVQAAMR